MEGQDSEEREPQSPDTPDTPPTGSALRGAHAAAVGVAALIVLLGAIWRCG